LEVELVTQIELTRLKRFCVACGEVLMIFEQMQGGVPIRIGGTVVGAAGVSGFDRSEDVEIS
jgi:uncharacterized protein GlcG (DUF336 family)